MRRITLFDPSLPLSSSHQPSSRRSINFHLASRSTSRRKWRVQVARHSPFPLPSPPPVVFSHEEILLRRLLWKVDVHLERHKSRCFHSCVISFYAIKSRRYTLCILSSDIVKQQKINAAASLLRQIPNFASICFIKSWPKSLQNFFPPDETSPPHA